METLSITRLAVAPLRAWKKTGKIEALPETEALLHTLDKVYDRLRKRARAEWLLRQVIHDPSDACVSVQVHCTPGDRLSLPRKNR